jgi:uncharacterized membrane protein YhhN
MKGLIAFLIFQLVAAFVIWVGGYNFDTRGPGVALLVVISILLGSFIALAVENP